MSLVLFSLPFRWSHFGARNRIAFCSRSCLVVLFLWLNLIIHRLFDCCYCSCLCCRCWCCWYCRRLRCYNCCCCNCRAFFFTITCAKASKYEFTGIFRYCELYHIIKIEHVCASVQAWVRAFSRVYNNVLTYSIQ